jgi:hypothetical protein
VKSVLKRVSKIIPILALFFIVLVSSSCSNGTPQQKEDFYETLSRILDSKTVGIKSGAYIRVSDNTQVTLELVTEDKSKFQSILSQIEEVYVGFSSSWNFKTNGYARLIFDKNFSNGSITAKIDGENLKKVPEEVLNFGAKDVYLVGYKFSGKPSEFNIKAYKLFTLQDALKVVPGIRVKVLNPDFPKTLFAGSTLSISSLNLEDEQENRFSTIVPGGVIRIPEKIQPLEISAEYQKVNVKFTILNATTIPDLPSVTVKAKFDKKEYEVDETAKLSITAIVDKYGNEIPIDQVSLVSFEGNTAGKMSANLQASVISIEVKRVTKENLWNISLMYKGHLFKVNHVEDIIFKPNLKNFKISIPELELRAESGVTQDYKSVFKNTDVISKITDNYGNMINITNIKLSDEKGTLDLDFEKEKITYSLTKAGDYSVQDFRNVSISCYVPGIGETMKKHWSDFGTFSLTISVLPNVPKFVVLKDEYSEKVLLPTYYGKPFVVEYHYNVYDKYKNEIKNGAQELTYAVSKKTETPGITIQNEKIIFSNMNLRKPDNFSISLLNTNGNEVSIRTPSNREFNKIQISVLPIPREVKVTSGVRSLGSSLYEIGYDVDDGNGNLVENGITLEVNRNFHLTPVRDKNSQKYIVNSYSPVLESLVFVLDSSLKEMKYDEGTKEIEVVKSPIFAKSIELISVTPEKNLSSNKPSENAYEPKVSYSGNYIAYFKINADRTPALIVKSVDGNFEQNLLSQPSSGRRSKDTSVSELKQESVYSYSWIPGRGKDILLYTPLVNGVFAIYAYIPSNNSKIKLYSSDKNNFGVSVDILGRKAVWISGGSLMMADILYNNDKDIQFINFINPRTVIEANESVIISPAISPNGRYVAYISGTDIYLYDLVNRANFRLTNDFEPEFELSWSPESQFLSYYKKVANSYSLRLIRIPDKTLENKGVPELTIDNSITFDFGPPVWISANQLVYASNNASDPTTAIHIYDVTSNTKRAIKFNQNCVAISYVNVFPYKESSGWKLKVVYSAYHIRQDVFIGVF